MRQIKNLPTNQTSATETPDQARAAVEADLADVHFREPIVDDYDRDALGIKPGEGPLRISGRVAEHKQQVVKPRDERMDREWLVLTEAARQAIISTPEVRRAAAEFTVLPLSETLPSRAIDELAARDDRTAHLLQLTRGSLGKLLKLQPVSDDLLEPDLLKARLMRRRSDATRTLIDTRLSRPDRYARHLDDERVLANRPGITESERELVARRYRYARDVKMLGLMAELYDQPIEAPAAGDGIVTHELASGTRLVMTAEAFKSTPQLLDPRRWEGRRQLKDRVYSVQVDGRHYVMKERKTPRHTDLKTKGHRDGLTSQQEFETAQLFAGLGVIEAGDVRLHWEKPLGYVEFPDGYQFCLFESEPDLPSDKHGWPASALEAAILGSAEAYQEEFAQISQTAKTIFAERDDLITVRDRQVGIITKPKLTEQSSLGRQLHRAHRQQPAPDALTFKEFAKLKAHYLVMQAKTLMDSTMLDHGYMDTDRDGFAFRLEANSDNRTTLEIIGFDIEYYTYLPEGAAASQERMTAAKSTGEAARGRLYTPLNSRGIAKAAAFALMERQLGLRVPPRRA